jgi:hypothetical protein
MKKRKIIQRLLKRLRALNKKKNKGVKKFKSPLNSKEQLDYLFES